MLIVTIVFCVLSVVLFIRLRNTRKAADRLSAVLQLRNIQECRERKARLVYERALGIPLTEPARSEMIWARAFQGDEICEAILLEEIAEEINSPDAFVK